MRAPLNSDSVAILGDTCRATNGVVGRYVRGNSEVELVGVADRLNKSDRGDELEQISTLERDWLFNPERMILDGIRTVPHRGDKWITESATYEVTNRDEPEPYRMLPEARLVRVFTIQTDVDL